jgi:putative Holliday junction resolvase
MSGSSEGDLGESSGAAEFPAAGRLLGLDFGTKRIGIAISTPTQTIASPLESLTRSGADADARRLRAVAGEYGAVGIVVGLPVHMSGEEGGSARLAREFGQWAAGVTGLPLRFWDERFTSAAAEEHLLGAELTKKQRQRRIDKLAAQIMLQSYLDAPDRVRPPAPL